MPRVTLATQSRRRVNCSMSQASASPPLPEVTSSVPPSPTTAATTSPMGESSAPRAAPTMPSAVPTPVMMLASRPKVAATPATSTPSPIRTTPASATAAAILSAETTTARFWRIQSDAPTMTRVMRSAKSLSTGASAEPMTNTPCLMTRQRMLSVSLSSAASLAVCVETVSPSRRACS